MAKLELFHLTELFEAVQMGSVFPDGKTFPDCLPKSGLLVIKEKYAREKNLPGFDLKTFVTENFSLPKAYSTGYQSDPSKGVREHIEILWSILTRQPDNEKSSLIPLPYPYVVPGGRFREIYYWDSYFTMLGLRVSGRIDMISHMVDNFSWLIDQIGYIPNGNRSYYVGRSQPPFYSLMVKLLAAETSKETLVKFLPQLEKEYQFWMLGSLELAARKKAIGRVVLLPDGSILNRFWDKNNTPRPESYKEDVELSHQSAQRPEILYRHLRAAAESGWDFSSRWFSDPDSFASIHTTDIIPVDLNCLLVHLEETLVEAHALAGDKIQADRYLQLAEKRKAAIQTYCWDESAGFYFDYDFKARQRTPHWTMAAAFPLFFGVATQAQADRVADALEKKFLQPGGFSTTLLHTGQQWDAPNGWAPLQWMAYKGLQRYGHDALAEKAKSRWVNANQKVFQKTGKLTEKYDVFNEDLEASGGEYPNQDGFGWTNGVLLGMS